VKGGHGRGRGDLAGAFQRPNQGKRKGSASRSGILVWTRTIDQGVVRSMSRGGKLLFYISVDKRKKDPRDVGESLRIASIQNKKEKRSVQENSFCNGENSLKESWGREVVLRL